MNQNLQIFFWSLSATLGGFLFGFDTAIISGVGQTLQTLYYKNPIVCKPRGEKRVLLFMNTSFFEHTSYKISVMNFLVLWIHLQLLMKDESP